MWDGTWSQNLRLFSITKLSLIGAKFPPKVPLRIYIKLHSKQSFSPLFNFSFNKKKWMIFLYFFPSTLSFTRACRRRRAGVETVLVRGTFIPACKVWCMFSGNSTPYKLLRHFGKKDHSSHLNQKSHFFWSQQPGASAGSFTTRSWWCSKYLTTKLPNLLYSISGEAVLEPPALMDILVINHTFCFRRAWVKLHFLLWYFLTTA